MVFQAHQGRTQEMQAAQSALIMRYAGAVHRYLLAALRDEEAANDVDQEFALRFLRGDFHRADPKRGRFRDFVKRSLHNLMVDYHRRQRRLPRQLPDNYAEPADGSPEADAVTAEFDRQFLDSWRKELMSRAWDSLGEVQRRTGRPVHTVLKFRVDHPDLKSAEVAERLSKVFHRTVTGGWVRQVLLKARELYVGFLLDDVIASLDSPTTSDVEEELIDLGLHDYCKEALMRRIRDGLAELS